MNSTITVMNDESHDNSIMYEIIEKINVCQLSSFSTLLTVNQLRNFLLFTFWMNILEIRNGLKI